MSFAYAPRYGAGLMLGAGLSIGVHGALVALWLTQAAAFEPPEEAGIQGRELIDLAEVEMIMAAPETDLPDGPPAEDSQATLESPAEREEAKASNDPLLAQIPHTPDDPELQFKIANPDQEVDTDKEATETPTELQEETENENAAQSTAAAPKASAGQDEQDQSAAKEQGLTDAERAEITDWQKSLVLALNAAKDYPRRAREARAEGTTTVAFTLDQYGQIKAREVSKSSGWPVLDQAALDIFDRLQTLPRPPSAMGAGPFNLAIPISYRFR
ncbi:TonB family protein [Sulfitobacter sp. SBS6]|uniref:energy transducer TonB n=1 Tax=Sulfitobacter sp. SBS6 TaxID=3401755 RepID=UPI003AACAD93